MNWCGMVGEVRELFRSESSVGYHWVVPKIFSMSGRVGPVYYSPSFRFLNMTWHFGIYRSKIGDEEWIGFEIRRSTDRPPMSARFSVGLLQADKSEYLLHRNQNFPSRDNVCSINEFLLKSVLLKIKDKLAPSDELTVTCVMWSDVPAPGKCEEFWHCEQNMNSGGEVHAHKKERKDAVTEDVSMTKYLSLNGETETKSIAESNKPAGIDCTLREITPGDKPDAHLSPSKTTPDFSSLNIKLTRMKSNHDVLSRSESALSSKEFHHFAQNRNSGGEAHAHKKGKEAFSRRFWYDPSNSLLSAALSAFYNPFSYPQSGAADGSPAEDVPVTKDESHCVETETKSIAVSDNPSENDGRLREISRGVEWDVLLPPPKTTWDVLSPEFTCGGMKYHISVSASEIHSDDVYLGFIVHIAKDVTLPIRWRMAVKRRDFGGLSWIMNGQTIVQGECHQHAQEICIKRAKLERYLSSDSHLTFVHYLSVGEVNGEKAVSTQTDKTEVSHETQTEDQIGRTANLEEAGQRKGSHYRQRHKKENEISHGGPYLDSKSDNVAHLSLSINTCDKTEVSKETETEDANLEDFEEQFRLCLTHPEEGDYVRPIQKKPLNPSIEKFLSELPRDDEHFIFAA